MLPIRRETPRSALRPHANAQPSAPTGIKTSDINISSKSGDSQPAIVLPQRPAYAKLGVAHQRCEPPSDEVLPTPRHLKESCHHRGTLKSDRRRPYYILTIPDPPHQPRLKSGRSLFVAIDVRHRATGDTMSSRTSDSSQQLPRRGGGHIAAMQRHVIHVYGWRRRRRR